MRAPYEIELVCIQLVGCSVAKEMILILDINILVSILAKEKVASFFELLHKLCHCREWANDIKFLVVFMYEDVCKIHKQSYYGDSF